MRKMPLVLPRIKRRRVFAVAILVLLTLKTQLHFGMLSPDPRTFIAHPRQKIFKEDLSCIPRVNTASMRATTDREGNEAVRLHRSFFGRVASGIWDFMKIKRKTRKRKREEIKHVASVQVYPYSIIIEVYNTQKKIKEIQTSSLTVTPLGTAKSVTISGASY